MTYARQIVAAMSIALVLLLGACGGGGGSNNPSGGNWDSMTWDQDSWS